jgi:2'-5' RNA ligase
VGHYLSLRGFFSTPAFNASSFVLFSSKDSIGGGPYIVEERFQLAGRKPLQPLEQSRPSAV